MRHKILIEIARHFIECPTLILHCLQSNLDMYTEDVTFFDYILQNSELMLY